MRNAQVSKSISCGYSQAPKTGKFREKYINFERYFLLKVCLCAHSTQVPWHMHRTTYRSQFPSPRHCVDSWAQTQVIGFAGKCLYLLSNPTGPKHLMKSWRLECLMWAVL